jgi:hypothetical protein
MTVEEMEHRMQHNEFLFWMGLMQAEHDEAVEQS